MREIYSVVAAFDTNADAEDAVQLLEKSGLNRICISIENRVSPIQQGKPDLYNAALDMTSWTITGAICGGLWVTHSDRDRLSRKKGTAVFAYPLLSCLGSVLKGACLFAGMSFIGLSLTKNAFPHQELRQDEATLLVDPYLLVVHGTPATVIMAGDVLSTASTL